MQALIYESMKTRECVQCNGLFDSNLNIHLLSDMKHRTLGNVGRAACESANVKVSF